MIVLTEQQRLDAIRACEGIEAALAKQEQAWKNILEIFERQAKRSGDREGRATTPPSA